MGQSPEEFDEFLDENKEVVEFLRFTNENGFSKIFELEGLKIVDDLIKTATNEELIYLLKYINK
jgi:hypothetical protein